MASKVGKTRLSLAEACPELAMLWHPTKNYDLTPEQVSPSSDKKIWWQCCDHSSHTWEASVINQRKSLGVLTVLGQRFLLDTMISRPFSPEVAAQFHSSKNEEDSPDFLSVKSAKKLWWKCSQGHEWSVSPSSRSRRKTGCPKCCLRSTSKVEKTFRQRLLASEVLQVTSADHTARVPVADFGNGTAQVDIMGALACGHTVVIQYDGSYWHNLDGARERDLRATRALIAAGYTVIRIRETTKEHTLPFLQWEHKNLLQLRYEFQRSEDYTGMLKVIHRIEEWLGRHECFTDVL